MDSHANMVKDIHETSVKAISSDLRVWDEDLIDFSQETKSRYSAPPGSVYELPIPPLPTFGKLLVFLREGN